MVKCSKKEIKKYNKLRNKVNRNPREERELDNLIAKCFNVRLIDL